MKNDKLPDEEDDGNPLIELMFDFFTEPATSRFGNIWGSVTAWLVAIHILAIGIESCDGPNQYTNRPNRAKYPFLLTADGYWVVELVCLIPLVIDACGRIVLGFFIFFVPENRKIRAKLLGDYFNATLYAMDIVGVLPFLFKMLYLRRNDIVLDGGDRLVLELIDLLLTGRILRITKDIPAIWAIRVALRNSGPHLVLPFFVFMVFNITAAVVLYFAEPCYNIASCPWHDIFEAMFFSVVTMTTSEFYLFFFNAFFFSFLFLTLLFSLVL